MPRLAIFHLASGPGDSPGRPVYEYVRNLLSVRRFQGSSGVAMIFLTFDNFDWRWSEADMAAEIRRRARRLGARPVVVLHTVLPFVGSVVSPDFLDRFPSVLFPHQLKLLPEVDRRRTFEYVDRADRCLVTSGIEVEAAVTLARETGWPRAWRIAERFLKVGQPPSILPPGDVSRKTGDVAVFGMIRRGKGLSDVLRLAEGWAWRLKTRSCFGEPSSSRDRSTLGVMDTISSPGGRGIGADSVAMSKWKGNRKPSRAPSSVAWVARHTSEWL